MLARAGWLGHHLTAPSARHFLKPHPPRHRARLPSQGSAADLAKAAMVAIHARLAAELPLGAARLVLQIHDEFLLEVGGWVGWCGVEGGGGGAWR